MIKRVIKSSMNAMNGMKFGFKSEMMLRFHFCMYILAIILVFSFNTENIYKITTLAFMFLTVACELLNTAIENLCDEITKKQNENIKNIKDMAGGAVMLTAIVGYFLALFGIFEKLL